jgi:hypothetical protein
MKDNEFIQWLKQIESTIVKAKKVIELLDKGEKE